MDSSPQNAKVLIEYVKISIENDNLYFKIAEFYYRIQGFLRAWNLRLHPLSTTLQANSCFAPLPLFPL